MERVSMVGIDTVCIQYDNNVAHDHEPLTSFSFLFGDALYVLECTLVGSSLSGDRFWTLGFLASEM